MAMTESERRIRAIMDERDRRYEERFISQEKALALALTTYPTKQDLQQLNERVVRAEGARAGGVGLATAIATSISILLAITSLVVALLT